GVAIGDGHIRVREAGIAMLRSIPEKYTDRALTWIKGNAASMRAQQTLLTSILNEPLPKSVFADIARSKSGEILLLHATFARENRSTGNTARSLLQHTLTSLFQDWPVPADKHPVMTLNCHPP
ncbi:MAG: hypothetical protein OEU62_08820, partial [Gammaproteobacteria bacterium]|nr:hypothetical protein [Gammaproteobacteria bacterium]